jgi:hypothetical protein
LFRRISAARKEARNKGGGLGAANPKRERGRVMSFTLIPKGNEGYVECYARTLGSVDRYKAMSEKALIRRWHELQSEFGSFLLIQRREPHAVICKELIPLIEAHHDAATIECRIRLFKVREARA